MAVQVKLFGDLREKAPDQNLDAGTPSSIKFEKEEIDTIFTILEKFNIQETEISHLFVNGKFCGLGKKIKDGDRIGIFPRNMGLMFIEIAKNNTISITVKFFADLQKFGPAKSIIDVPEGSTVLSILEKYSVPIEEKNLIIMANGKPHVNSNYVLQDGDIIAIFPLIAGG